MWILQLQDVRSAPFSLLRELSKKITEQGGGKKSLVKTIIIGSVPDRGGRANEMRPKATDVRPNYGSGGNFKKRGGGNSHNSNKGGTHNDQSHGQTKKGRFE